MPKPRTKRAAVREERKRKRFEKEQPEEARSKRPRPSHQCDETPQQGGAGGEREFFGLLADEEQEYFRSADEMLELNQFPSAEERDMFIDNVYREAQGKELKLASSQSCSRLMERLIQLSTTAQKKHLFEAFAGHFLSLVQHRFASHCCEALFLRSAGVVTQELAGFTGFVLDTKGEHVHSQKPEASMESLFLATLDELEGSLSFLVVDRFASHALRVLLLVLSGRPLEDASARTLVKSRKKEYVSVAGSAAADEQNKGLRVVPGSFAMAVDKIIADTTAELDATALLLLARHPIGNPTLQLLLELDMSLHKSDPKSDAARPSLLLRLLPGAPQSLADESSPAAEFVTGMMYDQIGSRLMETLVAHCPGKVFKPLNQHIFLPRIEGYVRNDISSYPAIKVLNRLGKDDLVAAVDKIAPTVPQLVSKSRFNVLRTLFERCAVRGASSEIKQLMKGLREGCGSEPAGLITTLCCLSDGDEEKSKGKSIDRVTRNEYAIQSHGAQLLSALLAIPGPAKGVQEAILALENDVLIQLATTSMPTVTILTSALSTPSTNSSFQKAMVGAITAHIPALASSQFGHNLINAIAGVPSKGKDLSVPYHVKEAVMQQLAALEPQLRDSWMGRSVWRSWKGDMWKARRGDWKAWMRELKTAGGEQPHPVTRQRQDSGADGAASEARKREQGQKTKKSKRAEGEGEDEEEDGNEEGEGKKEDSKTAAVEGEDAAKGEQKERRKGKKEGKRKKGDAK